MGFGSAQNIQVLTQYKEENGLMWTFAQGPDHMARDFRVVSQSTKLGIGPHGIIATMKGYGSNDAAYWHDLLSGLGELGQSS